MENKTQILRTIALVASGSKATQLDPAASTHIGSQATTRTIPVI